MKNDIMKEVPELTVVSSKGQLVIPKDIRNSMKIKEGSVMAVSSATKDMLVLKKIKNPISKEDMEILKDLEEAYAELARGEFEVKSKSEFLKELRKW